MIDAGSLHGQRRVAVLRMPSEIATLYYPLARLLELAEAHPRATRAGDEAIGRLFRQREDQIRQACRTAELRVLQR